MKVVKAIGRRRARRTSRSGFSCCVQVETRLLGAGRISIQLRDETVAIRGVVATQRHIGDGARKPGEDRLQASNKLLKQMNPGSERD